MDGIIAEMDRYGILSAQDNPHLQSVSLKFKQMLKKLENNELMDKLLVKYFRMVSLMKQIIEAQRTGNWHLHLDSVHVQAILSHFHVASHLNYEKLIRSIYKSCKNFKQIWIRLSFPYSLIRNTLQFGDLTSWSRI